MQHDPLVCVEDAIKACELISQFIQGMKEEDFYNDAKTKAAVERKIEIIGESLNRIKAIPRSYWRLHCGCETIHRYYKTSLC